MPSTSTSAAGVVDSTGAFASTGASESSDASLTFPEPDLPAVSCDGLDEPSCNSTEGCLGHWGSPIGYDGDVACRGEYEFLGCGRSTWCHTIVVIACASPEGDPYWFGSSCYPEGWTTCQPPEYPTEDCPPGPLPKR